MNNKHQYPKFFLFVLILCGCVSSCLHENKESNPLVGKWIFNKDYYTEFHENGFVQSVVRGREQPGNGSISRKNKDGVYEETIFGPLKYRYKVKGDTIFYDFIGSENNEIWMRYGAIIDGNRMTSWNYKTLDGITQHIDEVGVRWKDGIRSTISDKKVIVIIDSDHRGPLHIAFDQETGDEVLYDSLSQPILEVTAGSILKTKLKADARFMSGDAFDFKKRDCITGEVTDLNDWGHNRYRNIAHQMINSDTVKFTSEDFQLAAFSSGFNQYARDILDYQFGEYLDGQVASFSIETLEDKYVYKDYIRKLEKGSLPITKD